MIDSAAGPVKRFIVFTDLDATLLDHYNYSWQPATPAIDALAAQGSPLILSSSKTLAEMVDLARDLNTKSPIISENGALIAIPVDHRLAAKLPGKTTYENYKIKIDGISRQEILEVANQLRHAFGYQYVGFSDWTAAEISHQTGLTLQAAVRASQRYATEPIVWGDTFQRWTIFESAIKARGIQAVRGGRFIHLMGQTDKAKGMLQLASYYRSNYPEILWTTVGLGDSDNDISMISQADVGVVVPNPQRAKPLQLDGTHIIQAPHPGPIGWNSVITGLVPPSSKHLSRINKNG